MRYEDGGGFVAEGIGLGFGRFDEFRAGDEAAGDSAIFEVGDIVHTARRARPSIGQGFDDHVALRADLLFEIDGCDACEGGLGEALYGQAAIG